LGIPKKKRPGSLSTVSKSLRGTLTTEDVALSVKEVYKLPENIINERFHVNSDEGCIYEIFGGPMLGMLGL
jgi:electron transfer flavoprotein-quinone oxidoreductase